MGFRAAATNTRELFGQRVSQGKLRYQHYDLWQVGLHFVWLNNVRFTALSLQVVINLTSNVSWIWMIIQEREKYFYLTFVQIHTAYNK